MQKMLAAPFTGQEYKILCLLADWCTYQGICIRLDIRYRTLNRHIENIMKKTGLNRKELLIKYAIEHGHGKVEMTA